MAKDLREELASLSADHPLELDVAERSDGSGGISVYVENPYFIKTGERPQWNDLYGLPPDRWEYQRLMPIIKLLIEVGPFVRTVPMTVGEVRAILNGGEDEFQKHHVTSCDVTLSSR